MNEPTPQEEDERAAVYHARRKAPVRMEYSEEYSARKDWATYGYDDNDTGK